MKFRSTSIMFVFVLIVSGACTSPQAQVLSTPVTAEVISSYPSGLNQPKEEGVTLGGIDDSTSTILNVEKEGRYRMEWYIQSPKGGKVELINTDPKVEAIFGHIVLLNLDRPSEGAMEIALVSGEYNLLSKGLEGEWSFRFLLIEERDF